MENDNDSNDTKAEFFLFGADFHPWSTITTDQIFTPTAYYITYIVVNTNDLSIHIQIFMGQQSNMFPARSACNLFCVVLLLTTNSFYIHWPDLCQQWHNMRYLTTCTHGTFSVTQVVINKLLQELQTDLYYQCDDDLRSCVQFSVECTEDRLPYDERKKQHQILIPHRSVQAMEQWEMKVKIHM